MARKNTEPVITHTEIYSLAIRSLQGDIDVWKKRCDKLPEPEATQTFEAATSALTVKLNALKELYRIEAGSEYI